MSDALRDGVERFLAGLRTERQLSPHTADGYGRDLAALLDYCEAQGITAWEALDPQHVRSFAAQCHRRGLAPRSIQRRLSAVRSLCRWLIREGELRREDRSCGGRWHSRLSHVYAKTGVFQRRRHRGQRRG